MFIRISSYYHDFVYRFTTIASGKSYSKVFLTFNYYCVVKNELYTRSLRSNH